MAGKNMQGREKELERLAQFNTYEEISSKDYKGKIWNSGWVEEMRGDEVRSR